MRGEGGSEQPYTRVEVQAAVGRPWRGQLEDGLGEHLGGAYVHLPEPADRHREVMAGRALGDSVGVCAARDGALPCRADVDGCFYVGLLIALNQRRDVCG